MACTREGRGFTLVECKVRAGGGEGGALGATGSLSVEVALASVDIIEKY